MTNAGCQSCLWNLFFAENVLIPHKCIVPFSHYDQIRPLTTIAMFPGHCYKQSVKDDRMKGRLFELLHDVGIIKPSVLTMPISTSASTTNTNPNSILPNAIIGRSTSGIDPVVTHTHHASNGPSWERRSAWLRQPDCRTARSLSHLEPLDRVRAQGCHWCHWYHLVGDRCCCCLVVASHPAAELSDQVDADDQQEHKEDVDHQGNTHRLCMYLQDMHAPRAVDLLPIVLAPCLRLGVRTAHPANKTRYHNRNNTCKQNVSPYT